MFCSNIKHNLSWNVDGSVTPCNQLHEFPKYNSTQSMKNSTEFLQLKDSDENDTWPKYCIRCRDKESIGLLSKRQSDNLLHNIYVMMQPNYLKIDGAIGSTCNAGCRICGPRSSTFWQQEDRKFQKTIDIVDFKKNTYWDEVWNHRDQILQLDIGGGEPWLNQVDQQQELFDYWIQNNRSKIIKIRYNTNGSLYPQKLIEKLLNFREVRITLSIDDIENRFEYNRYPLKWNLVLENIKKLAELESAHSNIVLDINFTVRDRKSTRLNSSH